MSEIPASVAKSSRDPRQLHERLARWFASRFPEDAATEISEVSSPSATGMSSETLLFDAAWSDRGARRRTQFVLRLAPDEADVPVFPVYDLELQFRILRLAGEHGVPVPPTRWLERDPAALGAAFFVMERVAGRVPPDLPPYPFAGWLLEARAEERDRLIDSTLNALAALHAIDVEKADVGFLAFDLPGATPLARHVENQRRYYEWAREDRRHPIIERAFDWLRAHWPAQEGPTVVSWGDARIGNVLYDGFDVAAVLDWEMAALAPREVDLGWMVFLNVFFQKIAEQAGLAGIPGFLERQDVMERYAKRTGYAPGDFAWYEVYAALRHAIVMTRVTARTVHFGQSEWPEDVDEVIPHRATLERMLDGSYWQAP